MAGRLAGLEIGGPGLPVAGRARSARTGVLSGRCRGRRSTMSLPLTKEQRWRSGGINPRASSRPPDAAGDHRRARGGRYRVVVVFIVVVRVR